MDGPGRQALYTVGSGDTLPSVDRLSDRRERDAAGSVIESAIKARQVAFSAQGPLNDRADLVERPQGDNPG
jgi:hypothetical protein